MFTMRENYSKKKKKKEAKKEKRKNLFNLVPRLQSPTLMLLVYGGGLGFRPRERKFEGGGL
jgi:hypothetical protein